MTTYNGWTNYETWNVPLWIDNEYGLYQAKMEFLAELSGPVTPGDICGFVAQYMKGHTPDVPLGDMHAVNWQEIADSWETERQENAA